MNKIHTFVICTYKDTPYLNECICAIKNQTIESEVIISSSTLTEQVVALAEKYHIPIYEHNFGGTIGKDWNYGFSIPKTKYVTIAHQDDVFLPTFLETNLHSLMKNKNAVIAFTNYCEIDGRSIILKRNRNLRIKDFMLLPFLFFNENRFLRNRMLSFGYPICSPTTTYNMEYLHGFKFSETVCGAIDWEAFYRINKIKGKWLYNPKRLMYHRIHADSETSNTIIDQKRTEEEYMMFKKYWPDSIVKLLMKYYVKAQDANKI